MKSLKTLVIASFAAASLAVAVDASAQQHHGGGAGHSGGVSHGWHGGGARAAVGHGWHGGGGWRGGGGWHGGYYPRYSFYLGAPFLWPSYYYPSSPYYYYPYDYGYPGYMYPPEAVQAAPEEEEPTTQAAPGPGSPTQGPLYMNYCESSKAYYPKVASCPEGWKFIAPG
jgi:hypothetical protein